MYTVIYNRSKCHRVQLQNHNHKNQSWVGGVVSITF